MSGVGKFADRQRFPFPCMVLSDLKMPRMNGLELLEWMRAQPGLKRIPFVFLTASWQQCDINRAYDLGASSFLVKPIRLDSLTELLRHVRTYWLDLNQFPELPSTQDKT